MELTCVCQLRCTKLSRLFMYVSDSERIRRIDSGRIHGLKIRKVYQIKLLKVNIGIIYNAMLYSSGFLKR